MAALSGAMRSHPKIDSPRTIQIQTTEILSYEHTQVHQLKNFEVNRYVNANGATQRVVSVWLDVGYQKRIARRNLASED
jgi:hypothetical protein